MSTAVARFRTVAFWEGISFLVLLLLAMPLKYAMGMPLPVRAVGSIHGVLFIGFLYTLGIAAAEQGWGVKRLALYLASSLVPGGTFWIEAQLRRELARLG